MSSEAALWLADDRRLRVMLSAMTCRSGGSVIPIPLDHPALAEGRWQPEWHDPATLRRWTAGDAVVPLAKLTPANAAPGLLELEVAETVPYPLRRRTRDITRTGPSKRHPDTATVLQLIRNFVN
jgi:hypothetical protein